MFLYACDETHIKNSLSYTKKSAYPSCYNVMAKTRILLIL